MEDIFERDLENKRRFAELKEKFGYVVTEIEFLKTENTTYVQSDITVALSQQAYIDGSAVERPIYKASGVDSEGNEYEIEWEVFENWEQIEDMQEMCDWDIPVSVERI